jgi:hypothetical protein
MGTTAPRKSKSSAAVRIAVKRTSETQSARNAVPTVATATSTRKRIRLEAPDRGEPIGEALETRQTEREAPDAGEGIFHSHVLDF